MQSLNQILKVLKEQRGIDFSAYRKEMIERRLNKRIYNTKNRNTDNYLKYLNNNPDEVDKLIDVFTINVSRFFRNSLTFEFINKIVIPELYSSKNKNNNSSLRIWSAGCSFGEEPYSMAIMLKEFQRKEKTKFNLNIFATDIDKKALEKAKLGRYNIESIRKLKYAILLKYFTKGGDDYLIDKEIRRMVQFSYYDMLDNKRTVPSDSIFGGFDIVLCRNVLIYFNTDSQKIIFRKLFNSLNKDGYLIIGEAEVPVEGFRHKLRRENKFVKIYRKIS